MEGETLEEVLAKKKKAENGTFGQIPHIVLYGLPGISAQDRCALTALIGLTWLGMGKTTKEREGPYKLSTREIANITGIQHASLRSKDGKAPREGVLDRLQAINYISFFDAKPIDPATGKEGRKQTYLYIHLERIWADNATFVETWNKPSPRPALWGTYRELTVDEDNSSTVDVDNSSIVDQDNTIVDVDSSDVDQDNTIVDQDNTIVDQDDVTVDSVSTKSPTITRRSQTFSNHTEVDPSSNQNQSSGKKPIGAFYLESCIKDLLLSVGEYWNRREHTKRLQQIYLQCTLEDEDVFKAKVEKASKDAMMARGSIDCFYDCLCSALHLEQVE